MCKVSVIIPYYNSEKTILRALVSVVNQTYKDLEIILIDDGSTDNTHKIVEDFIRNDDNCKFIHIYQENRGPSKARNEGIKRANGEYIAFLDSDDSWDKDKLKIQVDFMEKNSDINILGTDYIINSTQNFRSIKCKSGKFKEANFYTMLLKHFFITPTVIIRRDIFKNDKGMLFNINKKYAEDTLLYLKICRKHKGGKICMPLTCIYKSLYGQDGLSKNIFMTEKSELNNFKILYKENYKEIKKLPFIYFIIISLFSVVKFIRRFLICILNNIKEKINEENYND